MICALIHRFTLSWDHYQAFVDGIGRDLPFVAMLDLPPQFGSSAAYSATLGHKANHRPPPRNNAEYLPYSFHPVLGRCSNIMVMMIIKLLLDQDHVGGGAEGHTGGGGGVHQLRL